MENLIESHGGNVYKAREQYKGRIMDFSASINPLGFPSLLKKEIFKKFSDVIHYPDPYSMEAVKHISRYWKIKKENVLAGNGSAELIHLILQAFKPSDVLIPVPSFSEYERAAVLAGSNVFFVKLKERENFALNFGGLSSHKNSDVVFICNPNNPTGNLLLSNPLKDIRQVPGKLVVADEAFMDFLPEEKYNTLLWKAVSDRRIIVIRTLTKFFAIPGLRIGYLVAHKDNISKLRRFQVPWSVNSIAQMSVNTVLNDRRFIEKSRDLVINERIFLSCELSKMKGIRTFPSVSNFLLLKLEKEGLTAGKVKEELLKKGILVRDCSNFRGLDDRFIRVAVRTRKENTYLLKFLKGCL